MNQLGSSLGVGLRFSSALICAGLLAACGSSSEGGGSAGAGSSASGNGASGNGAGGTAAASAGSANANANGGSGTSSAGASGGSAQGGISASSGAAGTSNGASGASSGGSAGSSSTTNVVVSTHPVSVPSGKVFNVADDFFNDGFIPPSPLANFGFHTPIVPVQRADGSLDVAWLDYSGGKSAPMELPAIAMINVTHVAADLSSGATVATGIQSYRLLGFTSDPSGAYYIAYNADHPFKNDVDGDANNVNGNELKIAKFSGNDFASKAWDVIVFGDQDNTKDQSKGNAGAAGSGVLGFDAMNQKLVVYVAHQMAWGDNGTRHQAGFFAYIDPSSGKELAPGGGLPLETGAGWFYSHDFDQRLFIDSGTSYLLGHGDAFPRQLGLASFTLDGYTKNNASAFDQSYFSIDGSEGDNDTNAETGQFIRLSDGRFVMIHTSAQGRTARDVHVVIASSSGVMASDAWLTSNTGNIQATMPKLEVFGPNLFVTYGSWDSTSRTNHTITWSSLLIDPSLKPVSAVNALSNVEFVASSPMFRFAAGPNAGDIGWVSGNAMHTLTVNVASAMN